MLGNKGRREVEILRKLKIWMLLAQVTNWEVINYIKWEFVTEFLQTGHFPCHLKCWMKIHYPRHLLNKAWSCLLIAADLLHYGQFFSQMGFTPPILIDCLNNTLSTSALCCYNRTPQSGLFIKSQYFAAVQEAREATVGEGLASEGVSSPWWRGIG